jgi:hypothetical protein
VTFLPPGLQAFTLLSPCVGTEGINLDAAVQSPAGLAVDVPGPDQVVNLTRTGSVGSTTGELTIDVIVRRLERALP